MTTIARRQALDPDPPPPTAGDLVVAMTARPQARLLLARTIVVLGVALGLSTSEVLTTASQQPFGTRRTIALTLATEVDELASSLLLDRPGAALQTAVGRPATDGDGSSTPAGPTSAADTPAGSTPTDSLVGTAPLGRPDSSTSARSAAGPAAPTWRTASTAAGGRSATTEPHPTIRVISPAHKLRVWAGGDSLGEYVGNHLLAALVDLDLVTVELDYRISTGLARPDYFDWPARLAEVTAAGEAPDVVVFMVGGNDNQNMERSGEMLEVGSDDWYREYETRVASIADAADPGATHIYWIGLPPMQDRDRNQLVVGMNDVVRRLAMARHHVSFIDIETMFTGPDGGYSANLIAPDGQLRLARQADGVHITLVGSTWVASAVWQQIVDRWSIGERTVVHRDESTDRGAVGRPH